MLAGEQVMVSGKAEGTWCRLPREAGMQLLILVVVTKWSSTSERNTQCPGCLGEEWMQHQGEYIH